MKTNYAGVGVFVVLTLMLFSTGLFFIGDRQRAFSHHIDYFTDIADVNGLASGSKVRVAGFDAGQLQSLQIPDRPSGKFRLQLHIDDRVRKLVRENSWVTVETDGIVGDKFLLIHDGTDASKEAANGAILFGKEPVELSDVVAKATTVIDQASGMIGDVQGKLNVALDTATTAINNVNGLVTDVRSSKGPVGVLLNDQQTAARLKQTVVNAELATDHINQISIQAGQLVTDVQSRNLPSKLDDTLVNARSAAQQLNQASTTVNATLATALAPDATGDNPATDLRNSLSNVSVATANLADDTEALKHGFLFRGYFKKRGFYSLQELSPDQYRRNAFFQGSSNRRYWLDGAGVFTKGAAGNEVLTEAGKQQIDGIVGDEKDGIIDRPIVIEGYSGNSLPQEQLLDSRSRSLLIAHYLEKRFHLRSQDIGVMALNATPPQNSGKSQWDGAVIVVLASKR